MNTIIIRNNKLFDKDIEIDISTNYSIFVDDLAELLSEFPDNNLKKYKAPLINICELDFNNQNLSEGYYIYSGFKQNQEIKDILEIYDYVDISDLKARLLDLSWVFNKDGIKGKLASKLLFETICQNYESQPWYKLLSRIKRCLHLNSSLNYKELKEKLFQFLVEKLTIDTNPNHFLLNANLAELIFIYPNISEKTVKVITKLALNFSRAKRYDLSFKVYTAISENFKKKGNKLKKRKFQILAVRSKLKIAELQGNIQNQELLTASLYQEILDLVSKIENTKTLKEKILIKAKKAQDSAVSTFKVTSQTIDNKDIIKYLYKKFRSENFVQSIFEFVSLYSPPSIESAIEIITENSETYQLRDLVALTRYDFRNKVVSNASHDSNKKKKPLHSEIIEYYLLNQSYYSGSVIRNALIIINKKIHIGQYEILELVKLSPLIPTNQKIIAAEAIHAGFNFDLGKFVQYSTPLYESILRNVLINLGQNVLIYDHKTGQQTEYTLGKLLDHELIEKVFGKNIIYDMKTLLDDSNGYKLRHIHAHGMFEDNFSFSDMSLYSFLLFTNLVLAPVFVKENSNA
ncbi:DUF4209 domain-containing protein [Leptospira mtsangambouensis]|uniref:DUF4209 domain-containing protein n=1 Tax=Leptospira mtsangambouensis TaxID=2484912 RepID=UPI001EEAD196|nr:DUF4209 domain-containing protein [Leptospira mtsangambouensis]MCG6140170.1 DUF4209 domain-containing protein [Leptospira mtsangambouensis]